jgi:fatty acid desaturase
MDASFYTSEKVSKETLQVLMQRSNFPALTQFLTMLALILVTAVWAVLAWNGAWWNLALSQIGFGVMVCSTFACLHETAHGTAFESRRLNRFAAFLTGLFHLYPSSLFRELHFAHHRHTHIPGLDPEISLGNRPAPSVISNLPMYLGWLSGLPLLLFKAGMLIAGAIGMPEVLRANLYPFVRTDMRRTIALESIVVLSFQLGLLLLAIYVYPGFWAIFTGQIVGHCLLAAYLTPEHNGLPHDGNILEKTRSMDTSGLIKLLMWNMPYHAEHHAFPAVPFHALPNVRQRIQDELKHRTDGYSKFHLQVLKSRNGT